jgi:hypothetical protein
MYDLRPTGHSLQGQCLLGDRARLASRKLTEYGGEKCQLNLQSARRIHPTLQHAAGEVHIPGEQALNDVFTTLGRSWVIRSEG